MLAIDKEKKVPHIYQLFLEQFYRPTPCGAARRSGELAAARTHKQRATLV